MDHDQGCLFPSGRWVGIQKCVGHGTLRLALLLTFKSGKIEGSSVLPDETVTIQGTYDGESLECRFTFRFDRPGDIDGFRGFREGRGIWGTWQCPVVGCTGGFQIWPAADGGDGFGLSTAAEEPRGHEDASRAQLNHHHRELWSWGASALVAHRRTRMALRPGLSRGPHDLYQDAEGGCPHEWPIS